MVSVVLTSCRRCESTSFDLELRFISETGQSFEPTFNRVYSLYADGNLVENSKVDKIPIDLSRDSTVLIFDLQGELDTLAFGYDRDLNVGNNGSGYCILLGNERIIGMTTFSNVEIHFDSPRSSDDYTAVLYY